MKKLHKIERGSCLSLSRSKPRTLLFKSVLILFLLLLLGFKSQAQFSGSGSGTELDPYIITSADQLNEVRGDLDALFANKYSIYE